MTEDALRFGQIMKVWFRSNEWPQSITDTWAKATGEKAGPWNSQISICMRGKHEPKTTFFQALARFNRSVHTGSYMTQGITDRVLIDRMNAGKALCHDNGEPWSAADFFACFINEREAPGWLLDVMQNLSQDFVDETVLQWRTMFDSLCRDQMLSRIQGWVLVEAKLSELDGNELRLMKEVVCGLHDLTAEEATALQTDHRCALATTPLPMALRELQGEAKDEVQAARRVQLELETV